MVKYFITGTSRGLGKALAELILERGNGSVTGLARTNTISHPDFHFEEINLAEPSQVGAFSFPQIPDAEKIVLVNNAGAIGHVKYAGKAGTDSIVNTSVVNLTAPMVLTNNFLARYGEQNTPLVILNISSGAAKNPIDGWSTYCATKAGLEMYSRVVAEELAISGKKHIRIFSVAPGIVDTAMQDEIRRASVADFSRIQQFIDYKITDQLAHPSLTSAKLLSILELPEKFTETVFSARDL